MKFKVIQWSKATISFSKSSVGKELHNEKSSCNDSCSKIQHITCHYMRASQKVSRVFKINIISYVIYTKLCKVVNQYINQGCVNQYLTMYY